MGIGTRLQHLVERELRLPEIDADACVYSSCDSAGCRACVEACPSQAWILDDRSLGLDTGACDGCGLCVPACPGGAISVHFPFIVRQFGGHLIALFACRRSDVEEDFERMPCINALGLRQLLLLYNSGIAHLLVATGECGQCRYHCADNLQRRHERLNRLLEAREKPALKILNRSARLWEKIYRTDEIVSRGTRLSRRQFLGAENQSIRRNLLVLDPLNLAESRTVPPGELLPPAAGQENFWPWVPQLDSGRCNGCDACMNLCPTGALTWSRDETDSSMQYRINPAACTGCGICLSVCDSGAISIRTDARSRARNLSLKRQNCSACGNRYHLPREADAGAEKKLCRICAASNHAKNLFQVLD